MKWITPNKEKVNWTMADVRFTGIMMASVGFALGFLIKGLYF